MLLRSWQQAAKAGISASNEKMGCGHGTHEAALFFTEERLFRNKKHKIGSDHFLVPEIFFIALCGQVEDSVVLT